MWHSNQVYGMMKVFWFNRLFLFEVFWNVFGDSTHGDTVGLKPMRRIREIQPSGSSMLLTSWFPPFPQEPLQVVVVNSRHDALLLLHFRP
jgi:hypothetical protein